MSQISINITPEYADYLQETLDKRGAFSYYDEVAKLGSDYGAIARDYGGSGTGLGGAYRGALGAISDFYSDVASRIQLSNGLFITDFGASPFSQSRNAIRGDLAREHASFVSQNGRLPTTNEIFEMHEHVFEKHGVKGAWAGTNNGTLIGLARALAVDVMIGNEANDHCFLAGTEIDMWPVEAVGLVPDKDGKFDQDKVRAAIWKKPIEQIQTDDRVVSFSDDGLLIPGKVGQTFQNRSKHILDVPVPQFDDAGKPNGMIKSLMITPGHVTYCAEVKGEENPFADQFVPIMDILRSDGALKMQDGTLVRAATGAIVGSEDDKQVWTHVFEKAPDGSMKPIEKKLLRLGTRWVYPDGSTISLREHMNNINVELIEEGKFKGHTKLKGLGAVTGFEWTFSPSLPKPEDYVLQRSAVTLEEIYAANEWESVQPQMPAPVAGEAGQSYKQTNATLYAGGGSAVASSDHMPRNVPLSMRGTSSEKTHIAPQEVKPAQHTMSRKQRRAHEARMRKEAKSSKRKLAMVH